MSRKRSAAEFRRVLDACREGLRGDPTVKFWVGGRRLTLDEARLAFAMIEPQLERAATYSAAGERWCGEGMVHATSYGYVTTPFPKTAKPPITDRKIHAEVRRVREWLRSNAEAAIDGYLVGYFDTSNAADCNMILELDRFGAPIPSELLRPSKQAGTQPSAPAQLTLLDEAA